MCCLRLANRNTTLMLPLKQKINIALGFAGGEDVLCLLLATKSVQPVVSAGWCIRMFLACVGLLLGFWASVCTGFLPGPGSLQCVGCRWGHLMLAGRLLLSKYRWSRTRECMGLGGATAMNPGVDVLGPPSLDLGQQG